MILRELSLSGQASLRREGSVATSSGSHPQAMELHLPPVDGFNDLTPTQSFLTSQPSERSEPLLVDGKKRARE